MASRLFLNSFASTVKTIKCLGVYSKQYLYYRRGWAFVVGYTASTWFIELNNVIFDFNGAFDQSRFCRNL